MFGQDSKGDAYCMDERFTANTDFVTWSDIRIKSTKLRGSTKAADSNGAKQAENSSNKN